MYNSQDNQNFEVTVPLVAGVTNVTVALTNPTKKTKVKKKVANNSSSLLLLILFILFDAFRLYQTRNVIKNSL
jgi:hypothetical protein